MVKHSARMPVINRPVSAWIVLLLVPLSCGLSLPSPQCLSVQQQKAPNVSSYLYQIQFNSTSVSSRESLNVALRSAGTDPFEGYVMMAFDNSTDQPIGTFTHPTDGQVVDCLNGLQNAVASSGNATRRSVDITWTPPEGYHGDVIFRAAVVGSSERASPAVATIRVEDTSTAQVEAETTDLPLKHPVYAGCGDLKGCFGYPDSCVTTQDCSMLVTYSNLSSVLFEFEIFGSASANSYVAVAFSTDRKMGDDSVVECVYFNDKVDAHLSWNIHEDNLRRPDNNGLILQESSYKDGNVYCKVHHVAQWTMEGFNFDLMTPYYLLLAQGPSRSNNIQEHKKETASKEPIDLTVNEVKSPPENRILKILHGSFMVAAWLISASIGTFLPRYMKKTWVGKQLMGKDIWFFVHRALMGCVWLLTMTAFVLIFIANEGWGPSKDNEMAHGVIGCIVTGVTFLQPIGAALRPAPNDPKRPTFNLSHGIGGHLAHILAITCIFLAVEMDDAELPFYTYWILTAHIVCYVVSHAVLSFLAKKYENAVKSSGDYPGSRSRRIVFWLHTVVMSSLAVAVIFFIAGIASA